MKKFLQRMLQIFIFLILVVIAISIFLEDKNSKKEIPATVTERKEQPHESGERRGQDETVTFLLGVFLDTDGLFSDKTIYKTYVRIKPNGEAVGYYRRIGEKNDIFHMQVVNTGKRKVLDITIFCTRHRDCIYGDDEDGKKVINAILPYIKKEEDIKWFLKQIRRAVSGEDFKARRRVSFLHDWEVVLTVYSISDDGKPGMIGISIEPVQKFQS